MWISVDRSLGSILNILENCLDGYFTWFFKYSTNPGCINPLFQRWQSYQNKLVFKEFVPWGSAWDSAAFFTLRPAGRQIVWKPGHCIWHQADREAVPDCDGCVWLDARNTSANRFVSSMWWPKELQLWSALVLVGKEDTWETGRIWWHKAPPSGWDQPVQVAAHVGVHTETISLRARAHTATQRAHTGSNVTQASFPFLMQFPFSTPHTWSTFFHSEMSRYYLKEIDASLVIPKKKREHFPSGSLSVWSM